MMRSVLITEMDSSSVNAAASSAEKSIFHSNACQQSCHFACRSDSYKSDYNRSLQHGGYIFHWPDERSESGCGSNDIHAPVYIHDRACKPFRHRRRKPDFTQSRHWKQKKAASCSSFCIWTAAGAALLYGIAILFLRPCLLPVIGADSKHGITVLTISFGQYASVQCPRF